MHLIRWYKLVTAAEVIVLLGIEEVLMEWKVVTGG